VTAIEAVPPAIASFVFSDGFEQAVIRAVNLGGDTDTLGAMAGAVAGAYYGASNIPSRWLQVLENEGKGHDYIRNLSLRAARIVSKNLEAEHK
jgi:poly(ADP-ribose) glycohydrolase ARH3